MKMKMNSVWNTFYCFWRNFVWAHLSSIWTFRLKSLKCDIFVKAIKKTHKKKQFNLIFLAKTKKRQNSICTWAFGPTWVGVWKLMICVTKLKRFEFRQSWNVSSFDKVEASRVLTWSRSNLRNFELELPRGLKIELWVLTELKWVKF